jgi:hypothetical protein
MCRLRFYGAAGRPGWHIDRAGAPTSAPLGYAVSPFDDITRTLGSAGTAARSSGSRGFDHFE